MRFECVYCGEVFENADSPTGSDIVCCGEKGHVQPIEDEELRPCPACPDGSVWNSDGPTCKPCPVCLGYAAVKLDGSPCDEARKP